MQQKPQIHALGRIQAAASLRRFMYPGSLDALALCLEARGEPLPEVA